MIVRSLIGVLTGSKRGLIGDPVKSPPSGRFDPVLSYSQLISASICEMLVIPPFPF